MHLFALLAWPAVSNDEEDFECDDGFDCDDLLSDDDDYVDIRDDDDATDDDDDDDDRTGVHVPRAQQRILAHISVCLDFHARLPAYVLCLLALFAWLIVSNDYDEDEDEV